MNSGLPLVRRLRHFLISEASRPRWSEHSFMFDQALLIVRVYYIITLYILYGQARRATHLHGSVEEMDLLWPVYWLEWTGLEFGGAILAHLFLAGGLLGAIAWRYFAVRALVSIALLMSMAETLSYGAMSHGQHEWFWISICFLFLPNARPADLRLTRGGRLQFLLAFGSAPALVLLFYTLSGFYKIAFATSALFAGEFNGFHPHAMATTLAWRAIQTGSVPLWAETVIDFPLLGWPLYTGLYFVEFVAFAVFFRPELHKIWGVLLICFHLGTLLFMDIIFPLHVLINGLFLVMSPFAPRDITLRDVLAALPLFGTAFRRSRTDSISTVSGPASASR